MVTIPEVRQKIRDALSDGTLTTDELTKIKDGLGTNYDEATISKSSTTKVKLKALIERLAKIADNGEGLMPKKDAAKNLDQLLAKAQEAGALLDEVEQQIADLEADSSYAGKEAKLEQLKTRKTALRYILRGRLKKAVKLAQAKGELNKLDRTLLAKAGLEMPKESASKSNFKMNSGKAMSTGANQAQQNAQQSGAAKAQGASFPTMKASVGGASFNTNAYMHSLGMDNAILQSYDSVLENQKRGRELVTLFAYFANRAASGDMGMMYQFMKFLTYIVTKDKAKQQIDMGKKLIALQDESRRATNKLLNAKSDPNDPNASFEQSKLLTEVKSETDAIATSQKLIAQMMEEFTVISETLTSSTKVTLDSHRRIQQTVSRA